MTRINTNVSSLIAQNTLGRSNADLNQALTRLSTGLRINTGKDDPAGLIASENLRSDITSIRRAISNTDRANQVIATADSALGQVSSLLNDIRGLVTESANTGALSDDQLAANQLQLDSSLEALNRIAQTTTFQGRRLLDGSLDFIITAGTSFSSISDLKIDQANLGATGSVSVDISVTTAATGAQVDVTNIPAAAIPAVQSTGSFNFGTTAAAGLTVTALAGGAAEGATGGASGGIDLIFVDNDDDTATVASVAYNSAANTLTITADFDGSAGGTNSGVAEDAIATAITNSNGGVDFTATAVGTTALVAADATTYADVATGGADAVAAGITQDVVLEISGSNGAEVFSFGAGTEIADLVSGINLQSDATDVTATANGTTLELTSSTYGSNSIVDLKVISEGSGTGTFTTAVGEGLRAVGTDIVASVNGVSATGNGNRLTINTATLDLTATIDAGTTGTLSFTITGGGALFQLGPDVVSNQQARLGIGSVNTARLGGVSGKLFQLGTGGSAELTSSNLNTAAKIVEEAIDQVTSLRGRLGAFQRTTLETNRNALNDTLVNLSEAESSIRDADFAAESAALTRAQILVQAGTTVLQIANSNPQNVLALLR